MALSRCQISGIKKAVIMTACLNGADTENRTRDLTLTKGALYQLSHISITNR